MRKSHAEAVMEKLDHRVKVLLKEWAGFSGFSGYKSMDLNDLVQLLNTDGWSTYVDYTNPSIRLVYMEQGDCKREAKFSVDDGEAVRDY
ncbi:hypothetical protein [Paenibacillus macquariensis]|uniref:Uncharacterized protein n=1 Tax=Paenibacillus macquariensis TaxID=948756 RepID=A0ABY1K1K7_9BACL|nr:hypothetical protein [Paenibacillus macquariensis]MEC0091782.1 hypothetical protein [Paenibacillus macquariensis]OAB32301.1 hypothetical protein PMSM_16970 [Paenibacillus macquariensis subsp. macquariensis]SIR12090.1 hypothetical protein SAMN05421578_107133 [Paenibacillus macquariensis]